MDTKHTPGPWHYDPISEGTFNMKTGERSEMRSAGFCITAEEPKMYGGTRLVEKGIRSEADARLIAAAPQLLNALCALMAHPDVDKYVDGMSEEMVRARDVIAKALGVQS